MRLRKKHVKGAAIWLVCLMFALISFAPVLRSVLTSFKTYIETQMFPPKLLPKVFSLDNYKALLLGRGSVVKPLLNSLEVSAATTVICLIIGIPAGYSLSRFKTKHTHGIQMWVIGMRMAPAVAVLVPYYIIYSKLGLVNSKVGLVILYVLSNVTFAVWLLSVFFDGVSKEIEEAAMVDGLSHWGTLIRIVVPLAANSILIIAAFVFIFSWNELIYAMNLCGQQTQTLPVILSTYASDVSVQYQMMTATQVIQIIPVAIITLLIQKNILTGLSFGAVKG